MVFSKHLKQIMLIDVPLTLLLIRASQGFKGIMIVDYKLMKRDSDPHTDKITGQS